MRNCVFIGQQSHKPRKYPPKAHPTNCFSKKIRETPVRFEKNQTLTGDVRGTTPGDHGPPPGACNPGASTGSHKRCRKNGSVLRLLGNRFREPGAVFGSRHSGSRFREPPLWGPFSGAAPESLEPLFEAVSHDYIKRT